MIDALIAVTIFSAFYLIMAIATVYDLITLRVPNILPTVLVIAFLAVFIASFFADANSVFPTTSSLSWHFLVALIIFIFEFGLFAIRQQGGGDVKIITSVALWLGWPDAFQFLLLTAFSAIVFILIIYFIRSDKGIGKLFSKLPWLLTSDQPLRKGKIPYVVAAGLSALYIFWLSDWTTGLQIILGQVI